MSGLCYSMNWAVCGFQLIRGLGYFAGFAISVYNVVTNHKCSHAVSVELFRSPLDFNAIVIVIVRPFHDTSSPDYGYDHK